MIPIPAKGTNRFGFSEEAQHVSQGCWPALIKAAGTVAQLNLALETISRAEQTSVKVAPRTEPPAEITPACKKFFLATAEKGTAAEIVKLAAISRRFRQQYSAALRWAQSQQSQTPINA